jgi:hypothetical protein
MVASRRTLLGESAFGIGVVALLNASHGNAMTVINWRASREHLRSDDVFFFCMAVVAVVAILVGFARTYFLAGMMLAPLPSLLMHIHAVVFLS